MKQVTKATNHLSRTLRRRSLFHCITVCRGSFIGSILLFLFVQPIFAQTDPDVLRGWTRFADSNGQIDFVSINQTTCKVTFLFKLTVGVGSEARSLTYNPDDRKFYGHIYNGGNCPRLAVVDPIVPANTQYYQYDKIKYPELNTVEGIEYLKGYGLVISDTSGGPERTLTTQLSLITPDANLLQTIQMPSFIKDQDRLAANANSGNLHVFDANNEAYIDGANYSIIEWMEPFTIQSPTGVYPGPISPYYDLEIAIDQQNNFYSTHGKSLWKYDLAEKTRSQIGLLDYGGKEISGLAAVIISDNDCDVKKELQNNTNQTANNIEWVLDGDIQIVDVYNNNNGNEKGDPFVAGVFNFNFTKEGGKTTLKWYGVDVPPGKKVSVGIRTPNNDRCNFNQIYWTQDAIQIGSIAQINNDAWAFPWPETPGRLLFKNNINDFRIPLFIHINVVTYAEKALSLQQLGDLPIPPITGIIPLNQKKYLNYDVIEIPWDSSVTVDVPEEPPDDANYVIVELDIDVDSIMTSDALVREYLQFPIRRNTNYAVTNGWNMVSVPMRMDDYRISVLYPTAISPAYRFDGTYVIQDTLQNLIGYWIKFADPQSISFTGYKISLDSIDLVAGWNLIGAISDSVAVVNITSIPPGIVTSQFFEFNNGYSIYDTLLPGKGYWVKVNQAGKLIFDATASATTLAKNRIKIISTNEIPPPPPGDISSTDNLLPQVYALEQAYPSPFNPSTTIKYSLPEDSRVSLKVYNVLGQVIATLSDEVQSAGFKSATWVATGNASGIYFYKLDAVSITDASKSFSQVRKAILLK